MDKKMTFFTLLGVIFLAVFSVYKYVKKTQLSTQEKMYKEAKKKARKGYTKVKDTVSH